MELPFLEEEIHYLHVALSAQVFQQPLSSVGKETAYCSILCKFGKERWAYLKQKHVESKENTYSDTKGRTNELWHKCGV